MAILYACLSQCVSIVTSSQRREPGVNIKNSEMENVIKRYLTESGSWVWTGFGWLRIASIRGLSYENGNRQVTKCLSRLSVCKLPKEGAASCGCT